MKRHLSLLLVSIGTGALACSAAPTEEGAPENHVHVIEGDSADMARLRAERNAEEESQAPTVAIEVEEGHTVNFALTETVGLVLYERWLTGQQTALKDIADPTPAGIFRALRPGEPVPAELFVETTSPPAAAEEDVVDAATPEEWIPTELLVSKHATDKGPHFRDHKLCPSVLVRVISFDGDASIFSGDCWLNRQGFGRTSARSSSHSVGYLGAYSGSSLLVSFVANKVVLSNTALPGENIYITLKSAVPSGSDETLIQSHQYEIHGGAGFHFGSGFIKKKQDRRFFYVGKGATL